MNDGIVIIGSGFAARQLVKNLRKQDPHVAITLIAADSMDEYNKPDLSHVISQQQRANDLTRQRAGEFAEQYNLRLFPATWVTEIDPQARVVKSQTQSWRYNKLVLATGSGAITPPVEGRELMLTLNSQQEYQACESQLRDAQRVLILGAGLIGSELAMDFCRAGKRVTVVDSAASLLASLMPAEVSARLQHCLTQMGIELIFNQQLASLSQREGAIQAALASGRTLEVDATVAAIGLRPNADLARRAGLAVNRGIVVNSQLQTSDPHIYALGDCAEINGQLLPFLQPIQLSAMTAAKNLAGASQPLTLPAMLVKVKTPALPLHLAGETHRRDLTWQITLASAGMVAKGADGEGHLKAFVVSEACMPQAFALLKELKP